MKLTIVAIVAFSLLCLLCAMLTINMVTAFKEKKANPPVEVKPLFGDIYEGSKVCMDGHLWWMWKKTRS